MDVREQPPQSAYEVAIFCAIEVEYTAIVRTIHRFDEHPNFRQYPRQEFDENHYTPGRLGDHNVLVIRLYQTGKIAAASAASTLRNSFPAIRLCILMGVCGGAPKNLQGEQIILGDVIISTRIYNSDRGRRYDKDFERYNDHDDLPDKLRKSIKGLVDACSSEANKPAIEREINDLMDSHQHELESLKGFDDEEEQDTRRSTKYHYPGKSKDQLFENDFIHRHQQGDCENCNKGDIKDPCRGMSCGDLGCDTFTDKLVSRKRLQRGERPRVRLHFGPYACADHVLMNARIRDNHTERDNVIAFEMEAAGIWDNLPTLVVKGVSNYADSHRNKDFQGYAATSSAKAVKVILRRWAPLIKSNVNDVSPIVPGNPGFSKVPLNRIFDAHSVHRYRFQDHEEPLDKLSAFYIREDASNVSGEMALLHRAPGIWKTSVCDKSYEHAKD